MFSVILHGRKLQKCRNLVRFSVSPLQNSSAFSNSSLSSAHDTDSSSQDGRKGHDFTVSYLVDSLGLTKKLAESISKKVTFEKKRNPDSILNLLRAHEFTDSKISSIVTDYPRLLLLDPEKSLAPKLRFLQSRGAPSSEVTEIVSEVPEILGKDRSFSVYYDFVKEVIETDKSSSSSSSSKLCHSLAQGSKQENKIRNLSVLRELGMPQQLLFPLLISNSPHVCGKEKFEESLKKVVELGFDPRTSKFLKALRIVYTLKKVTMEEKVKVYKCK